MTSAGGFICMKAKRYASLISMALGVSAALPASGQMQESTEPGVTVLDSITVTARKRNEIANDVPISMTVIEGNELS